MSDRIEPIDITCKACRAVPYERCRNLKTPGYIKGFHNERKRDARILTKAGEK